MSLIQFYIRRFIPSVVLCLIVVREPSGFRADGVTDPFTSNSVWNGICIYNQTDYFPESKPIVMILYLNKRKGMKFEGVTWYPTLENGLLRVTGLVSEKGNITFIEEKVIYGEATPKQKNGVLAGMKFTGKLTKTTLKGSGNWTGPTFNGEIQLKFSLKLAAWPS